MVRGRNDFAGTGQLLRLFLRRDRFIAPLWILLLSVPLSTVYVGSIEKIYPAAADRAQFAASIMSSPAQLAMYGPVYNTSLGAVGIWKAGMFYTIIGVAVILTVIRHTRAEEETGRAELVDSTAIGRYANLTAALMLGFGASLATGLIGTAGLLTTSVPPAGSLAFGLALTGAGLVFTAVAAVSAQLSPSARVARGIAFAVLGATYALRAIGDASSGATDGMSLSWLSPQGWSLQVRPYAGDRWWVLVLHLVTTTALTTVAFALLRRRDLGAGLIAERPGAAAAGPTLGGTMGLPWRLQRGTLAAWTVGLGIYGLLIGSVVHGIADEIGGSSTISDLVTRIGGTQSLENSFVRLGYLMLAVAASAYAISAALRLHSEESMQHGETILAAAVARNRWAASHIAFAVLGPVLMMVTAGLVGGVAYGLAAHDLAGKITDVLGAALVGLPAIWLLPAITVALFGLAPRWTPLAWGVLTAFVALFLLGSISGFPHWMLDLVPFAHTPPIPGGAFSAAPLAWLVALDAVVFALGLTAFRQRDLR
ncbi:ABC transporter permease [Skermania sp. ID1734]|uniref:ABC transporter permease n=1 Tax=Skermania sp. ID1734 TaxID=2597516 RepID=UPI001181167C|nr:ABC transporter permease [Skermania sp. ID1734]TSE02210.1 ABC transporter permease [Skermania sp. ID1734]